MARIVITGGLGYIASHCVVELSRRGIDIVLVDNLSNSSLETLNRLEAITGQRIEFHDLDIRNTAALEALLAAQQVTAVMHFAGLKSVTESWEKPLDYYDNNVAGTISLIKAMGKANIQHLVFSSSATVYGIPETLPVSESAPRSATNPYGQSKLMLERLLEDLAHADSGWHIACLRYFNPVGAHDSGLIGEDPRETPNNLMPYIGQVAIGTRAALRVFGNDYPTEDGTGVRDFIHVTDLALGHVAALDYLLGGEHGGFRAFNLGRGQGISVLELIAAFEKASGCAIPYTIDARRPGDVAACYADPERANTELDWCAERDIDTMCQDEWRWRKNNPNGYR
ncbi:UDP-glucose 4-epimerase GalE [Halomonas sp. HNIBRBA4712]|uniref:UDP-glucose 4-epimerase GalE n=1 Tax=Halomonas sp. HNIBRBA4712 TaxID=3373087 RepID=UPI00374534AA